MSLGHVGLNHLTWERSVLLDGVDVLPELLAKHADEIAPHTGMPADFIRHLGMVPSYYLRYYYAHDAVVESLRGATTRAEEVARLEAELLELYADPALDTKPPQLAQRGGAWYSEAAVDLLVSLTGDRRDVQVVNTFNHGTLPFLPDDAVIEVPAVIGSGGADPVPVDPVEPLLRGLIAHVYAYEELALDAALRGGRDRVYNALLAHPLVGQADKAQCLTDRLIAENAASFRGPEETSDESCRRAWSTVVTSAIAGTATLASPATAGATGALPAVTNPRRSGSTRSGTRPAGRRWRTRCCRARWRACGSRSSRRTASPTGASPPTTWAPGTANYQAVYQLSFSGLQPARAVPGQAPVPRGRPPPGSSSGMARSCTGSWWTTPFGTSLLSGTGRMSFPPCSAGSPPT